MDGFIAVLLCVRHYAEPVDKELPRMLPLGSLSDDLLPEAHHSTSISEAFETLREAPCFILRHHLKQTNDQHTVLIEALHCSLLYEFL